MNMALEKLLGNIKSVIMGEEENLQYILIALLSEGHVLLEGLPGVGKTKMALALSKSIEGKFKRLQFTPDVLPSDVTGYYLYNKQSAQMEYRPGAAMCNILLADEINRASPRVQSSLLEVMEEKQVTVEGKTMKLEPPFMVIATQNSIENEGTYPLPEAQLDRFFMKLHIKYPNRNNWKKIIDCYQMEDPVASLEPVMSLEALNEVKELMKDIFVAEPLKDYILDLVETINSSEVVDMGINPRGSIALVKGAKAWALLQGRGYVLPDDVQKVIMPIFAHRIKLKASYQVQDEHKERIIREALAKVKVPVKA